MTDIIVNDKLQVSNSNFTQVFDKNKRPTPLDFLEMSIAACIGLGIQAHMQHQSLINCPFSNLHIRISENMLKIECTCTTQNVLHFQSIVDNCYIMSNIKFEKHIIFAK